MRDSFFLFFVGPPSDRGEGFDLADVGKAVSHQLASLAVLLSPGCWLTAPPE